MKGFHTPSIALEDVIVKNKLSGSWIFNLHDVINLSWSVYMVSLPEVDWYTVTAYALCR